jgi:hypothetical protein
MSKQREEHFGYATKGGFLWEFDNNNNSLISRVLTVASRSRHLKSLALDGQVSRGALASLCDIFSKCNTLIKFYGLGGNVFSLAGH